MRASTCHAALALLLAGTGANCASANFPRASAGKGYLSVPVNTVERKHGLQRRDGQNAFEWTLHNLDFFYAAEVGIGTPAQTVIVLVDTGSSELWVNPDCSTAPNRFQVEQCKQFGKYNPRQSKTPPVGPFGGEQINYGDPTDSATLTSVSITYYLDNLSFGNANITNQTFGVVTQSEDQSQGILGLAPDLTGGFDTEEPYSLVLNTMAKQGIISSRVFALDLRHSDSETGAIIYGGIDKNKFIGKLESLPMVRGIQGEFRLAIDMDTVGLTLDGKPQNYKLRGKDTNVMLDSGTTLSRLHPAVAVPLLNALGAEDDGEGYYFVPCTMRNSTGSADFGFGSKTVRVPFKDFIMDVGDDRICYVGVTMTNDQQILGDSILRAGYFVFDWDNEAIHVAQAANCGDSDIVAAGSGKGSIPDVTGNCKEEDALFTGGGTAKPTKTNEPGSIPTQPYTTVFTVTSCPPIDRGCQTGVITTQTIDPRPTANGGTDNNGGGTTSSSNGNNSGNNNSNGNNNEDGSDGDSAAVERPRATGLLLGALVTFAALYNTM